MFLLIHRKKKKKKKRQSKCQILTFTLRNADILIKPLPFCEKDFSKRQFKIMLRQLKKPQDQLVALQLMLIDWLNFPITIQGLPYSMQQNQRLLIKAGGGGHSLSRDEEEDTLVKPLPAPRPRARLIARHHESADCLTRQTFPAPSALTSKHVPPTPPSPVLLPCQHNVPESKDGV